MHQIKYIVSNIFPIIFPTAALNTSLRLFIFFFLKNAFITEYKIMNPTELIIGATHAAVFATSAQLVGKILIVGDSVDKINKIYTCRIVILPLHFNICNASFLRCIRAINISDIYRDLIPLKIA
jgi:hypothetical protein